MEMKGNTSTAGKERREAKACGCGRTHILNRRLIGIAKLMFQSQHKTQLKYTLSELDTF